jgi:hypothetical protein
VKFRLSSTGVCRGASGTSYLSAYIFAQRTDTLEYASQPQQERRLPSWNLAAHMMEYLSMDDLVFLYSHVLDLPRAATATGAPRAAVIAAVATKSFQMLIQELALAAAAGREERFRLAATAPAAAAAGGAPTSYTHPAPTEHCPYSGGSKLL